MPSDSTNGWAEWGRHVLKELERLNDCYNQINQQMTKQNADIAKYQAKVDAQISALQVKAGVWGLIAGAVPGAIGFLIQLARNG